MTQNTEQNVQTREEQITDLGSRIFVGMRNHTDSMCEAQRHIDEAEARGAEEQRRKDWELSRARLFCQNEQEASDRTPERPDVVQWQKDRNEFFLSSTLEVVTEYAAWRDKKDAEGQEAVAWLIQDKSKGKPGRAYSPDRAVTDKAQADKAARFNSNVSALYTCPANVAALEARIAELVEAEQLARADAEASKVRVKVLEVERDRYRKCMTDCVELLERTKPGTLARIWLTDCLETARAALTREGGV